MRRVLTLAALTMVLAVSVGVFAGLPAAASSAGGADVGAAILRAPSSEGTSEGTSPATSTPAPGGLEVTAYRLEGAPQQITKGATFSIFLTIYDHRQEVRDALGVGPASFVPTARLNTSSFTLVGGANPVAPNPTQNGDGINYTLDIPVTYTGKGNTFQCDIFYSSHPNIPVYPFTLTLNQCVDYTESASDSSSVSTRGTGFVLTSASYGGSETTAGKNFTLSASFLTTNGSYGVENVNVTLALPKEIKLATGSSIAYVGSLSPNKTASVSFELVPNATAEEGSYVVTVKISGLNAQDGTPVEASADITIPVVQPERFEISNARMPEMLTVGMDDGSGYATIDLVNKGKGSVFNVEAAIVGEGLTTEDGTQFIGTIAGGGQNTVDFNIMATQGGQLAGQVVITYENARGEVKTLTHDFSVMASEMAPIGPDDMMPMPEPEPTPSGPPVWVWLLIGVVVVAGAVVAVVVVRKKRKAKRDAELEDDTDDSELVDGEDAKNTEEPEHEDI